MARRQHQFFDNLSFLDIMCGALGAVLFLFITVDKGGVQEKPVPKELTKIYLNLDTAIHQFHGPLPDSIQSKLDTMQAGSAVMLVINAIAPGPKVADCPPQEPCPVCDCEYGIICRRPQDHQNVCPDKDAHKHKPCPNPADHLHVCKDESIHGKTLCDDPQCGKGKVEILRDAIELYYKIGFALINENSGNDIDLKVCYEGSQSVCVPDGKDSKVIKKAPKGEASTTIHWADLREKGFLVKKAQTSGEIVLVEKEIVPGIYTIKARVEKGKNNDSGSAKVTAIAATKNGSKNNFNPAVYEGVVLKVGDDFKAIGRVKISANGEITKEPI